MRIALCAIASFAILCGSTFAAPKSDLWSAGNLKANKIPAGVAQKAQKLADPKAMRAAKTRSKNAFTASANEDQLKLAAPKGLKKVSDDKTPVKMNKIDDKAPKLMLKSSEPHRKMKNEMNSKFSEKFGSANMLAH